MKLFKKISALIAAVAIFGSTVLADDLKFDEKLEYAADAEKVTVNIYTTQASVGVYSMVGVQYDNNVYTLNMAECTSMGTGIEYDDYSYENIITWSVTGANITDVTSATPIFTLVFDVKAGQSPVGTTFSITEQMGDTTWIYNSSEEDYSFEDVSITVTGTQPPEPQPGDTTEAVVLDGTEKYMTVVDDSKATRYVVMDEKLSVPATGATVLKATYDGVTKQANLAKLLGVTIEEDGNINIGKLTIKMVLPEGAAQPTADIFGFVVE